MMKKGTVYGVSVGPGDSEHLTIKAVRILQECDIIAIPTSDRDKCFAYSIVKKAVPETEKKPLLSLHMPMTQDITERERAYTDGALMLKEAADTGKNVAFITIGDVCVYSTYLYLHEKLVEMGCNSKLIPGVTSFCAAAAELSVPLCRDNEELHIIPGAADAQNTLNYNGCKVYMKGNIPEIKAALCGKDISVCAVHKCGTNEQYIYRTADEIPDNAGYFTVIIAKENK